jgi:hypothetical protein
MLIDDIEDELKSGSLCGGEYCRKYLQWAINRCRKLEGAMNYIADNHDSVILINIEDFVSSKLIEDKLN